MNDYQKTLKIKMNDLAHGVYGVTKFFPREEIYGLTSQINRSSVSVILNYIEGYARFTPNQRLHFLEISFGSLKETQYLLHFTYTEKLVTTDLFNKLWKLADSICAMLWTEIDNLKSSLQK